MSERVSWQERLALAVATAALLLGASFLGTYFAIAGGIPVVPNPSPAFDGDPCCGWPDTWRQQAEWSAFSWVAGVPALFVLMGAWITARAAVTGRAARGLSRKTVGLVFAAALALQWGWFLIVFVTN